MIARYNPPEDPLQVQVASLRLLVKDYREILQEAVDLLESFSGSIHWGEAEEGFLEKVQEYL